MKISLCGQIDENRVSKLDLFIFSVEVQLKTGYAPQVRPDQGSNRWPLDHDSRPTFYVTETPALTTQPTVTFFSSKTVP